MKTETETVGNCIFEDWSHLLLGKKEKKNAVLYDVFLLLFFHCSFTPVYLVNALNRLTSLFFITFVTNTDV